MHWLSASVSCARNQTVLWLNLTAFMFADGWRSIPQLPPATFHLGEGTDYPGCPEHWPTDKRAICVRTWEQVGPAMLSSTTQQGGAQTNTTAQTDFSVLGGLAFCGSQNILESEGWSGLWVNLRADEPILAVKMLKWIISMALPPSHCESPFCRVQQRGDFQRGSGASHTNYFDVGYEFCNS